MQIKIINFIKSSWFQMYRVHLKLKSSIQGRDYLNIDFCLTYRPRFLSYKKGPQVEIQGAAIPYGYF